MVLLRRALVIAVLGLWLGGAAFYAVVAVPIGRHVLHDQIHRQNSITRDTTAWSHWFGVGALLPLAWDVVAVPMRRRQRAALGIVMALLLAASFALHGRMSALIAADLAAVADRSEFRWEHGLYLAINVGLCLAGLGCLLASLAGWREVDAWGQSSGPGSGGDPAGVPRRGE